MGKYEYIGKKGNHAPGVCPWLSGNIRQNVRLLQV